MLERVSKSGKSDNVRESVSHNVTLRDSVCSEVVDIKLPYSPVPIDGS
jgi:hypothetical protein